MDQIRLWDKPFVVGTSLVDLRMNLTNPIVSLREYVVLKLKTRLKVLNQNDAFAPNRELADVIQGAIASISNLLSISEAGHQQDRFVFTHTDLAPRNILISGDPLQISGILDFEFSGFFPLLEEYHGNWDTEDGDWPQFAYGAFLDRLGSKGIATPLRTDMKVL